MPESTTFYITTPIYYINDRPHIGHAYTSLVCDVAARFQRFRGRDTFFLTGTDEHGMKVEKSALSQGLTPQALADKNSAEFVRVLETLGVSSDDFIRTTQERHVRQVQTFFRRLINSGDVYLGQYEGWYDEGQEEYVPENTAAENDYRSPVSGRPLVRAREDNYFFRLSAYQERLERLYRERPDFVRPEARRNEMLGRLRDGLLDVPVSRTSFSWGVPVPGHEDHVIYVWVDALFNYITALGMGDPDRPEAQRRRFWPADYHVIGKEILFFHAVLWPALLMALDIPLPKCVYAHSYWVRDGRKMSKSLGNFIELETIESYTQRFGLDAWRWYMATQGPLGSTDADFSHAKFVDVYNADLANTVGNAVNRVTNMIGKYFDGRMPEPGDFAVEGYDWPALARQAVDETIRRMDALELGPGLHAALELVRKVNGYIDTTKPFSMAKDEARRADLATVLYQCAEALRIASLLLWAAMPGKMQQAWRALGAEVDPATGGLEAHCRWGGLQPGAAVAKGEPLFPRHVEE